jgi:DNA-binding transcriptional LysR family regulator
VRFTRFENMDLVTKKIGIMTAGFYVSQKYIDKHGHPKNSVEHKIIQVLEDQTHLEEAQALQQQFPNAKISLRTNSREAMIMGCKQGIGIACLPKFRAEIEDDLLELTEISVLPRRDVWLGVHSDLRHMPRIRAVIDAISEAFAGFK